MSVKLTAQENENEHTHSYYKEQLALENKLFEVNRVFCTSEHEYARNKQKQHIAPPAPSRREEVQGAS